MPLRPCVLRSFARLGLIFALVASVVRAEPEWFITTLTPAEREAAGLTRLEENEQASLNAQVARELKLARLGDAVAFAGTFSSRRPASEHTAAGLHRLTPEERANLDQLVARALAERPVEAPPRLSTSGDVVAVQGPRGEWHGELTLMYGRGSGDREFYGGSVTTIYEDPSGFGAALTLSQVRGDGWWYGDRYGRPGWSAYGYPSHRWIDRR